MTPTTLPDFYQPDRVGQLYRPDIDTITRAAADAQVRPAANDTRRTLLLLVDPQVDFVHTDGTLSVPGAVDDTRRTIEWLYRHLEHITQIAISLDSHFSHQIFYPGWWADADGRHPQPMTPITAQEVADGRWQPTMMPDWSRHYVRALEDRAKKTLMIWPYHTMLGTVGHAVTPALYEAITYHSEARRAPFDSIVKGRIPHTEHYSLFEPEIKIPGEPGGTLNTAYLDTMMTFDAIYVAGQAKSHCVLESLTSIANYDAFQPGLLAKIHLLENATSPVAHPEIDFDALANNALDDLAARGLHRITTADPLD